MPRYLPCQDGAVVEVHRMGGKQLAGAALALMLAVLLPFAGCGGTDRESYFKELSEINEELAARIGGLREETAEPQYPSEEGHGREPVEVLAEMAAILEEGARELSQVRVPPGGEEAHASLLELLLGTATGCREVASALKPGSEEEGSNGSEEREGGSGAEDEEGHGTGLGMEEGSSVPSSTGEAGHPEGH